MRVEAENGAGEGGVGHERREGPQIKGVAARALVALTYGVPLSQLAGKYKNV